MARRHVVAVDIGGTETKAALVTGTSQEVAAQKHARRPTPAQLEPLLAVIAELLPPYDPGIPLTNEVVEGLNQTYK